VQFTSVKKNWNCLPAKGPWLIVRIVQCVVAVGYLRIKDSTLDLCPVIFFFHNKIPTIMKIAPRQGPSIIQTRLWLPAN
jgi:hypothetical protein